MSRLNFAWAALVLALAGCNTTDGSQQAAAPAQPETLEPAAGDPKTEPEAAGQPAQTAAAPATETPVETPPAETPPVDTTAVDQAAQAYLNCVVGGAAQSASAGEAHEDAVESGVDACRNQFREARWAYKDTGVTDDAADRYGVNLLTFVRNEALGFLNAPAAQ